ARPLRPQEAARGSRRTLAALGPDRPRGDGDHTRGIGTKPLAPPARLRQGLHRFAGCSGQGPPEEPPTMPRTSPRRTIGASPRRSRALALVLALALAVGALL